MIRGERVELDTRRRRKDGTLIDVSVLGAPVIHEGKQIGDYAIYRDITERDKTWHWLSRNVGDTRLLTLIGRYLRSGRHGPIRTRSRRAGQPDRARARPAIG